MLNKNLLFSETFYTKSKNKVYHHKINQNKLTIKFLFYQVRHYGPTNHEVVHICAHNKNNNNNNNNNNNDNNKKSIVDCKAFFDDY